jgi:hypothetical protein
VCGAEPSSGEGLKKFGGESVGDMGRSVTQDVLWVSSTHDGPGFGHVVDKDLGAVGHWQRVDIRTVFPIS